MNPAAEPDKVRAQVGIMLQDSGSYSGIRVREMLELTASYSRDPLAPKHNFIFAIKRQIMQ